MDKLLKTMDDAYRAVRQRSVEKDEERREDENSGKSKPMSYKPMDAERLEQKRRWDYVRQFQGWF